MRPLRTFLLASLAVGWAVACSTFSTSDSPAPVDAGADGFAPAPPPPMDAGSDAPFCTGVDASFCWSFDQGADPLDGPNLRPFGGDGTDPTLADMGHSPPHAMRAAVADAGSYLTSALTYAPTAATHMHCDLWVLVESAGQGRANVLFLRPHAFGTSTYALNFESAGGSARMSVYVDLDSAAVGNVPLGTWTPIALDVDRADGGVTATGVVPGTTPQSLSKYPDAGVPPFMDFDFDLGLTFAAPSWSILYDDVICDWR